MGEADSLSGFATEGKPRTLEAIQDSIANKVARCPRDMDIPSDNPRRKRGAQGAFATAGPPFLWFVSFGGAKEMNSAVGPKTHIQIVIAPAIPY
jgi:hypothetical protein